MKTYMNKVSKWGYFESPLTNIASAFRSDPDVGPKFDFIFEGQINFAEKIELDIKVGVFWIANDDYRNNF